MARLRPVTIKRIPKTEREAFAILLQRLAWGFVSEDTA